MKYFQKIARYNVEALDEQLAAQPELWDRDTERTSHPVFAGTSDIWVRWRARDELTAPEHWGEPHWPVFWPAWHALPALAPIVYDLMHREHATHLGGILITRIPAGGRIKPHSDAGGWHAEKYNRKIYVPLRTNDRVVNYCGDERVVMARGQAWFFDNLVTHRVENDGPTERQTLIVCMQTET
jgi:hypothetical protein